MHFALGTQEVESRVRSLGPVVKRIAKHIAASVPASVDLDRLVKTGMASLIQAASGYRGAPGRDFDAFAVPAIRREMIDSLRGSISPSSEVRRRMREVEAAIEDIERRKKRPPSEREVANALRISLEEDPSLLLDAQGYQIVSYEEDDASPHSPAKASGKADDVDPLEALNDPNLRTAVIGAIDALPEQERTVLGLYLEHQLNHAEIGEVIGASEARVSEIYTQAIVRIRVAIRKH